MNHYLSQRAVDAALAFVDSVEDVKILHSEHPQLGSPRFAVETNLPELCTLGLARFPYLIFYTDAADAIRILRLLHTSRDLPSRFFED